MSEPIYLEPNKQTRACPECYGTRNVIDYTFDGFQSLLKLECVNCGSLGQEYHYCHSDNQTQRLYA